MTAPDIPVSLNGRSKLKMGPESWSDNFFHFTEKVFSTVWNEPAVSLLAKHKTDAA